MTNITAPYLAIIALVHISIFISQKLFEANKLGKFEIMATWKIALLWIVGYFLYFGVEYVAQSILHYMKEK